MAKIVKVDVGGGNLVDATEQDFQVQREEWNVYDLADGGRVRVKASVFKIFRVVDASGKPASGPDGEPLVVVKSKVDISAS